MTSINITKDYQSFIEDIKTRIVSSRYQAARAVNKELILLYHHIGTQILEKQKTQGWGSKVIEHLSKDLKSAFPEMKGFGVQNLKYMRRFAESFSKDQIGQQPVDQLPWGHIILIIYKIDDPEKRTWYIEKAISGIWSRDHLDTEIETDLYSRQGKAITNFQQNLPLELSKDATHLLKSPYNLDFLCLTDDAHEREIEAGMVKHIEKFLLELGEGFAFMGRQYLIRVDNDDYFMDMLFYNVKLRAYVVVELKAVKFTPSFVGQLNFYLSAVDSQMKHPNDNPSIGILLCKSQKGISVEYALRDVNKPIGVAEYRLTESLPEQFKTALPSIEELEFELSKHIDEPEKE
jgi:predicted nuclease of restriction endonuclease-like (RecB) superfamily